MEDKAGKFYSSLTGHTDRIIRIDHMWTTGGVTSWDGIMIEFRETLQGTRVDVSKTADDFKESEWEEITSDEARAEIMDSLAIMADYILLPNTENTTK